MRACRGTQLLPNHVTLSKALIKFVNKGGQGYLLEMAAFTMGKEEEPKIATEVKKLLQKFPMVCEKNDGLPPMRNRDHAITVKPWEQPPNIRPY